MKPILAFLLLCSSAFADVIALRVEISRDESSVLIGNGSAVPIGKSKTGAWVALTAKHNLEGVEKDKAWVASNGEWVPVEAFWRMQDGDAAVIMFRSDEEFRIPELNETAKPGDAIQFVGFPAGELCPAIKGTIDQEGRCDVTERPRPGHSGGGLFDSERRLVGVVVAADIPNAPIKDQYGRVVGYTPSNRPQARYVPVAKVRNECQRRWGVWWGCGIRCAPMPPAYPVAPPRPPVERVVPPGPLVPVPDPISLKGDKGDPGPPGPRGANGLMGMRGEPGPAGKDGKDGKDADEALISAMSLEIAQLKASIAALKKTKIPVQLLLPDGSVYDESTYTLGKPLMFQFSEIEEAE